MVVRPLEQGGLATLPREARPEPGRGRWAGCSPTVSPTTPTPRRFRSRAGYSTLAEYHQSAPTSAASASCFGPDLRSADTARASLRSLRGRGDRTPVRVCVERAAQRCYCGPRAPCARSKSWRPAKTTRATPAPRSEPRRRRAASAPGDRCGSTPCRRFLRLRAPPKATPPADLREQEHGRDARCAGEGCVAGGKRCTGGMDETVGRSRPVDERFDHGAEQRRQSFGYRVRQQGPPAPGHDQDDADPDEHQRTPEPASEVVEDQRHVLEQRCLDLAHPVGPVLLDRERLGGDEQGQQRRRAPEILLPATMPAAGAGRSARVAPCAARTSTQSAGTWRMPVGPAAIVAR